MSVFIINRDLVNSYSINLDIKNFNSIRKIELTSLKPPLSGEGNNFEIQNTAVKLNDLNNLVVHSGSIYMFKITSL